MTAAPLRALADRIDAIIADLAAVTATLRRIRAERTDCRDAAKAMGITYASFDQMVPHVADALERVIDEGGEAEPVIDLPDHLRRTDAGTPEEPHAL